MAQGKALTGRHVLVIALVALSLVVAANTVFITLALRTFSGEQTEDPYQRGLDYNQVIEQRAAQAALGWSVTPLALHEGDDTILMLDVLTAEGELVRGLEINGTIGRPAHDRDDQTGEFQWDTDFGYHLRTARLDRGIWVLEAEIFRAGELAYVVSERLTIE